MIRSASIGRQAAKRSGGDWLYSRSLSDGTLRYIALALMLADVRDRAVLCIKEPKNGIHPSRVPNLTDLLRDYAVDVEESVFEVVSLHGEVEKSEVEKSEVEKSLELLGFA